MKWFLIVTSMYAVPGSQGTLEGVYSTKAECAMMAQVLAEAHMVGSAARDELTGPTQTGLVIGCYAVDPEQSTQPIPP
jgi:hypothetical protein